MKEQNLAIDTFVPALRTLASVLDKAAAHAREKGTEPAALLKERLAPDMFPLSSQIQIACYHAKDGSARATGQEPPKIDVKELTFDEHKALITKTVDALQAIGASEFAEATKRKVDLSLSSGRVFESNALEFVQHWSIPHFYFHVVTAYDILRHLGVPLGKRDFMSGIAGDMCTRPRRKRSTPNVRAALRRSAAVAAGTFLWPADGPHLPGAAAAAEEPVAAVGFEPRYAHASRHIESLQNLAGLRIDAP